MGNIKLIKRGSNIHIKKANQGKFTDYCGGEVTGECILKGKLSSNPAVRKRAVFAENARKWKHAEGGSINGSPIKPSAAPKYEKKRLPGLSIKEIIKLNQKRYPGITEDLAAGRAPIKLNGHKYYLNGSGQMVRLKAEGGVFKYIPIADEGMLIQYVDDAPKKKSFLESLNSWDASMQKGFEKGLGVLNKGVGKADDWTKNKIGLGLGDTIGAASNIYNKTAGTIKSINAAKNINNLQEAKANILEYNNMANATNANIDATNKTLEEKNKVARGIKTNNNKMSLQSDAGIDAKIENELNKLKAAQSLALSGAEGLSNLEFKNPNSVTTHESEDGANTLDEVVVDNTNKTSYTVDKNGNKSNETTLSSDPITSNQYYKSSKDLAKMSLEDRTNLLKSLTEKIKDSSDEDKQAMSYTIWGLGYINKYEEDLKNQGYFTTSLKDENGLLKLFKSLDELYNFTSPKINPDLAELALLNPNGTPAKAEKGGIITFKFGGPYHKWVKNVSPTDDCGMVDPKTLKLIKHLRNKK